MSDFSHLRIELLLPYQIRAILERAPIAYVPIGTLEWHCEHLPVGLDALTAHGLCLRAAQKTGGVVLPCLHYGTGGDHGLYPFTIMASKPDEIAALLRLTLKRLQDFGFKKIVLLSGHFPDAQLEMIDALASEAATPECKVFATSMNRIQGLPLGPDHAGIFETTLLYALHPELVQLNRLPSLTEAPLAAGDVWEEGRHDPKHPIWGVIGPDPRLFKTEQAAALLNLAVDWLVQKVSLL